MNHDPLHRLSEEDEDAIEHDSVTPSHNEEHKRLGNETDEEKGIVHNDPSYSQHPTSSNKIQRRQSTESTRSYHSRVSSNRRLRSDKSHASITSNGSQQSRRSEMMRRKKNMSHLIKSSQGSGMILFEGNSENGDVKDSDSPAAQAKESKFYGWGEFSDSAFSESGSEAQSAKDKIELYVAFPDGEELDVSVTDSALSQQFEDVIMEDEYDSSRPWLRAPEIDQVSYESKSRSSMYDGDSGIHVIDIAEDESRRTKASTLSGIHSLVKSKSKNDARPKVGTLILTKENGSENGKSNDDIISGSDISELLEAKAALRHAQVSLSGYSSSHSRSTHRNSAFSISSLKADKIMHSTPVYRRPEPFRPGPAFEKKFAQSNRNLSQVSFGSMAGPWSSRTLQSQSSSNRTMTKTDGSERDIQEYSANIILEVPESMGKELYSPESKGEGNFDEETPRTTPSVSGDSEGGSQSNQTKPQVEVQSTPLQKQTSRGEISNRRRRSSVLEVVDEFEMEDEWDNYSAQSDEKEQQIKTPNTHTHNDLHLSTVEERNRMLELQEIYGSDTESESGQEIQEITPKRKPVLRRNSMESLLSVVTHVSSKCKHYTSACKRGYFRNKFALSIGILMAVVVGLGSLFVVFAAGKPGGDDPSPTPSPTKNAGIDQYIFTKTKVPTSAPNSEGESIVIIYKPKPNSSKPSQSPINVSSTPTLSEIPSLSPSLVGSNSNSSVSISENVTSLTPSPSISPAPVIATEIPTGYDTNSTAPNNNILPTLSPTSSKVASERADIIDISDEDNNDRTPSPTVFTMWPTVTDTYTKRFPPPPNRNSAYENQ